VSVASECTCHLVPDRPGELLGGQKVDVALLVLLRHRDVGAVGEQLGVDLRAEVVPRGGKGEVKVKVGDVVLEDPVQRLRVRRVDRRSVREFGRPVNNHQQQQHRQHQQQQQTQRSKWSGVFGSC
jgi:hypothetical protein